MAANVGTLTANLVAQTTTFTRNIAQAQKAVEAFNKRMESIQKGLNNVSKLGQKAGLALAGLAGAITIGVKNAAEYGTQITQLSAQTGLTAQALQEMEYVSKLVGFEFGSLSQMTTSLSQKVLEAGASGGQAAAVFKRLGISVRDSQGNLRSMSDLFDETIMSLSRLDNAVERNALAVKIFGEQGKSLIPLLEAGQDEINRMRREARDLGFVMGDTATRDLANFHREVQMVGARATAAGREILAQFLPAFRVVLDWVNRGISWFRNLSDEQRDNIKRWTALAGTILGLVAVFGVLAKAGAGIIAVFKTVGSVFLGIKGIMGAVAAFFGGFSAATLLGIGLLVAGVVGLYLAWKNNWFGIRDVVTDVWEKYIKPIIDVVLQWGKETLKTVWNWSIEALGTFWEWLKDVAWPWLYKAGSTAWAWTIDVLGDFFTWLKDVAWPWLYKAGSTAWEWTVDVLGDFLAWLKDVAWPWLYKAGSTAWEWTIDILGDFFAWLKDTAWPWLYKAGSTAWNWSIRILGAFFKWLRDTAWPWLYDTAGTLWNWTFDIIGDFFTWLKDIAWPWLDDTATTTWNWAFDALGKAWDFLVSAWKWIDGTAETTWTWTFKALGKLWEWIEKGADWIGGTVETTIEFGQKGLDIVKSGWQKFTGFLGFQRGGILPGIGGPDKIPALLAPGEAIIPSDVWRRGLAAVAEWFRELGVPGFQEGGILGNLFGGGDGGGFLGNLFPQLSQAVAEQGGIVNAMGNVISNLPQMLIGGLFTVFDGLIGVIGNLAATVLGEEEAERLTGTLRGWQGELKRFFGTLGFFEDEVEQAAEEVADSVETVTNVVTKVTRNLNLFSEMLSHGWAAVRENLPILKRSIELFQASVKPVMDELGLVIRDAMTPLEALSFVGLDLVLQSETFARLLELVNPLLEAVVNALGQLLAPLLPIVQVISDALLPVLTALGEIVGSLLVPVFQLLFPIVKGLGIVFLQVAKVVASAWNAILDLVSLLPFVDLRKYKINIDSLNSATEQLMNLTWEEARARAENTKAIEESTKALSNVPSVFRIALRRAQATGEVISAASIVPLQVGGIVRRPILGLLGEAGPEAVIPLDSTAIGGRGISVEVNVNGPIFGVNDLQRVIEEAISRAMRSAGLAEYGTVVKFL